MDAGADINIQGGHYGSALGAAALGGHEAIVKQLLDAGAVINTQGGAFGSALGAAALGGHEAIVRQLLDAGVKDKEILTGALEEAKRLWGEKYPSIIKLLQDAIDAADKRNNENSSQTTSS